MICPPLQYTSPTLSQLHPNAHTFLPIRPHYIKLYKPNLFHTPHTLHQYRYITLIMTLMHFSNLHSSLYIFSSSTVAIAGTLLVNIHAQPAFSVSVPAQPALPYTMTSNAHLDDSSGGSYRCLRSTSARKKNSKFPLNLDLLQIALSTSSDPDPTGPIAIRNFSTDCRQPPNRKPTASASQPLDSTQTPSKTKCRPRPDTDDDSDDSQTYSSRAPLNMTRPLTSLPSKNNPTSSARTTMPTQEAPSIPSSQPPTGPPSLFYPYLWLTFSVHETQNQQLNLTIITYTDSLAQKGMPNSEIHKCLSYRHSFLESLRHYILPFVLTHSLGNIITSRSFLHM
jgi:hypothetical protein